MDQCVTNVSDSAWIKVSGFLFIVPVIEVIVHSSFQLCVPSSVTSIGCWFVAWIKRHFVQPVMIPIFYDSLFKWLGSTCQQFDKTVHTHTHTIISPCYPPSSSLTLKCFHLHSTPHSTHNDIQPALPPPLERRGITFYHGLPLISLLLCKWNRRHDETIC